MNRIVAFSGGVGTAEAARRVIAEHGPVDVTLLFADTLIEDEDTYRFLDDMAAHLGVGVTRISDGRDPWQVFFDERFLGNHRIDPCSKILKREKITRWLTENCDPASTIVYHGLDWTEPHRIERMLARSTWALAFPLAEKPYLSKPQMLDSLRAAGITPPRLYGAGFPHNNCGGFCIKAGQAQFAKLLHWNRERYLYHEGREQELRAFLGRDDIAILSDRSGGGPRRPLTLRALRERLEAGGSCDLLDWGGCGCFDQADAALAEGGAPQ